MGIDCKVSLPANVRLSDVAKVIGVLLGCEVSKRYLGKGSWSAQVDGVVVQQCSTVGLASIDINKSTEGGELCVLSALYHYEFSRSGRRGLIFGSTAKRIALCRALAKFFGGWVDYQDCDKRKQDYMLPDKTSTQNSPEDGKEWHVLQNRILKLKPLTSKDIEACEKYAAYSH
jgi:hypothetical protein